MKYDDYDTGDMYELQDGSGYAVRETTSGIDVYEVVGKKEYKFLFEMKGDVMGDYLTEDENGEDEIDDYKLSDTINSFEDITQWI